MKDIGLVLSKFNGNNGIRNKRGLVNLLGKTIKFIAGNPDNDDLETINKNIKVLFENQNSEMVKINKFITFANNISQRIADDHKILNQNLMRNENILNSVTKREDIELAVLREMLHCRTLTTTALEIERTITLALANIANLEILTFSELMSLHEYLSKNYDIAQLIPYDNSHPFELLGSTRVSVALINELLTLYLEIPILKPFNISYSQVYPVPNPNNLIIAPPAKFILRGQNTSFWTNEKCRTTSKTTICVNPPTPDPCDLTIPHQCKIVQVSNSYQIVTPLKNRQILALSKVPLEVIENCHELLHKTTVVGNTLLTSPCQIIIGKSTFSQTTPLANIPLPVYQPLDLEPTETIKFTFHHLSDPAKIMEDATALNDNPFQLQNIHLATTSSLFIAFLTIAVFICLFRKRITELFLHPRTIIHLQDVTTPGISPPHP